MSLNVKNIPSPEIADLKRDCEVLLQASIYHDENNDLEIVTFFENSIICGST
jgi:hypothetical protein